MLAAALFLVMLNSFGLYFPTSARAIALHVSFTCFYMAGFHRYAKIGRWSEYRHGELGYITLSLISKSFLGWLVFGGSFQPDGDDDMR